MAQTGDDPPEHPSRPSPAPGDAEGATSPRVVIKKYANRRLYNTASSAYVTLEHLADMVKQGVDFVVYDAKTNDDITRSVLTQIIFEEESRGQNLLPVQFLRQLIQLYGGQMQSFVPSYLEASLEAFSGQQERLREQFASSGAVPGINLWEEQVRSNLALFERAMKMFTPFGFRAPGAEPPPPPPPEPPRADDLQELKTRMEEMQAQLARLASKG